MSPLGRGRPAASTVGGKPLLWSARDHAVDRDPDHRSERPQHADRADVAPESRSSTSTSPTSAEHRADQREPARALLVSHHIQPTTATGAVYSISSATPTSIRRRR